MLEVTAAEFALQQQVDHSEPGLIGQAFEVFSDSHSTSGRSQAGADDCIRLWLYAHRRVDRCSEVAAAAAPLTACDNLPSSRPARSGAHSITDEGARTPSSFLQRRAATMRRLTPLVVLGGVLLVAIVAGLVAGRGAAVSAAALDLSHEVMSPFCPGLTLSACPSPSAFELRSEIRGRFEAGESREEIFADLVDRFGHEIEGTPAATGLGAVVWLAPVVVAAILGLAVRFATRGASATSGGAPARRSPAPSAQQLARLDEELEQLE
jgi:cytochrome c-type biogenesis protein CcmH/NrfF